MSHRIRQMRAKGHSQKFTDRMEDPRCEEALIELFRNRIGIRIQDHQLPALRKAANEACNRFGFPDCTTLLQALTTQQVLSPELEFMIAGLTVGESYFFRDARQFTFLEEALLPELIRRKRAQNNRCLRIWSAGCADGQEIASIAILLREQLPDIEQWELHLLGTDINSDALSRAIGGKYRHWSLRSTPAALINKYFSREKEGFELLASVRNKLQYAWLNLTEDRFPSVLTGTVMLDLILCRNVFIYLEDRVIENVVNRFATGLAIDGILMLGAADPHEFARRKLNMHDHQGAFYFQRHTGTFKTGSKAPVPPAGRPVARRQIHRRASDKVSGPKHVSTADSRHRIRQLEHESRWQDVLDAVDGCLGSETDDNKLLLSRAMARANLGRLEQANDACDEILRNDPVNCQAYFIRGLVLMEQDDPAGAIQALRRALYIDRGFLEAHRQMGLLLFRQGHYRRGLKELKTALKLVEKADPERELTYMPGVNCERLKYILESEMTMYSDRHATG